MPFDYRGIGAAPKKALTLVEDPERRRMLEEFVDSTAPIVEAAAREAVQELIEEINAQLAPHTRLRLVQGASYLAAEVVPLGEEFGRLDILVNNAGIRRRKPALEVTEEDWDAVISTNLKGVFFCSQAAARHMTGQSEGRIINIASQLAVVAGEDRAAYCASKGGVANLTRALALEWIKHGITVNAIGPGPTETPGLLAADSRTSDELALDLSAHMPLGRRMRPEELVGAAVYLASPSAGAVTGHLLIVDGGWTAR